jgi:crotonobetainyl-CoA:carnitine CoA-transferase CaiB-like acyl-CoA transferase
MDVSGDGAMTPSRDGVDIKQNSNFGHLPHRVCGSGFNLLRDVKVLDLTTSVAGPMATMLLADMGAHVIKIERTVGGDDTRSWGPPFLDGESLWFLSVNRNKQSVALDYSRSEGLVILHDLVKHCDIVVVNLPARTARKLGVDEQTLRALRNDLIYVSITGFGLDGERADWTCYDLVAEGYSGIMDLTGEAGGEPQKVGAPAADMLAGQDAAFAAVTALFDRQRTGKGHVVDVALVDSMTRFLNCRILPYLGSGDAPTRSGGKDSVIAVYQAFETADKPMTLALGNDNLWVRFWETVGQPEAAHRPGFATNSERRLRRAKIVEEIQALLRTKPRAYWLSLLRAARIPAGPINGVDEVIEDTTLIDRGLFYRISDDGRDLPQVGTGIIVDRQSNVPRSAPPRHGAHTRPVLRELLGMTSSQIDALEQAKILKGRSM